MMNGKDIEIRWHGRGGQGAKTAALLLADVCFKTGAYVQGFPEYGPERMGAPITALNRISDKEIRVHSNIYTPDLVVVVGVGAQVHRAEQAHLAHARLEAEGFVFVRDDADAAVLRIGLGFGVGNVAAL